MEGKRRSGRLVCHRTPYEGGKVRFRTCMYIYIYISLGQRRRKVMGRKVIRDGGRMGDVSGVAALA